MKMGSIWFYVSAVLVSQFHLTPISSHNKSQNHTFRQHARYGERRLNKTKDIGDQKFSNRI